MRKPLTRLGAGTLISLLLGSSAVLAPPVLAGPIVGYQWNSIGPQPDCCFFPGGETGRATAIAVSPADVNDIWVGTAGGGVWHSVNGGTSWTPTSDAQASLAIGSLALAGCSAGTGCAWVYAGTGENAIRRDTYYGAGLLVGSYATGGVTWTLRDGKPTYDFTHGTIYNVILDPTTSGASQVIYITLSSGVTASATESTVTAPEPYPGGYGIYKSLDNGATWTKLVVPGSETAAGNGRPTDLEMDPSDPNVLYAGFLGRGVFKSTDGGTTWCPLESGIPKPVGCPATTGLPRPSSNGFDHVEVAIYRGDPTHLYATLGNCPDRLIADCEPSVYESTDAGLDWMPRYYGSRTGTPQNSDLTCPRGYSRYTHGLTISPTDPATLYVTGYHLCESNSHGQSWYAADYNNAGNNVYGSMLHPDHHALVFHATDVTHVYDVNDGGVAVSTDGGASWTPKTGGLDAFEFQSLAASPDTTDVFGGAQDNAGVRWTGTKTWQHLNCCGDGGFAAYETYFVGGLYNRVDMYITSNMGGAGNFTVLPVHSLDGGGTWPWPGLPPSSYDLGLDPAQPASFYPPLLLGGGYEIFANNALYTSVDELHDFTPRSPVLSGDPEPEISAGVDAITAVAVAPSLANRFYLGYYSGKVFESDAPCSTLSCWSQVASPSPGAPVTWLAVDPTNPDTVYATVSGFAPGVHVFKSTDMGASWSPTGSLADLNGDPANVIAVDPTDASHLLLGTDHGIYKSVTYGGSWFRYSPGLPNVPVYALLFDADHGRTFAATHGRGAYTLGPVFSKTLVEGPVNKLVLDQPAFGGGYRANQSCTVKVILQNGRVCASGSIDALGGTVGTDAEGTLVSTKAGSFTNLPVVWACAQGRCMGSDASVCQEDGNPIGSIEVSCGGAITVLDDPPDWSTPDPRSTLFSIGGGGAFQSGGAFDIAPAIVRNSGPERLCSVSVPLDAMDTQGTVLQRAADMINGDPVCMAAGVTAVVDPPATTGAAEDIFPHAGHISLSAPGISGDSLVASFDAAPGQATGICFSASGLDDPDRRVIHSMRLRFETLPGGAAGGTLTLTERSSLGTCRIPVAIAAGSMPSDIASAVAAAFQAPGDPSPYPDCPSGENPRDVVAQGDSVRAALASELIVCSADPAVGTGVQPTGVCSSDADCDDGNPCTADTCDPTTGLCTSTALSDGTTCDDANACTVGTVCMSGACGTPVSCDDGNPCTTDRCDPATGACTNTPVECDDGNPCTTDACTAAGTCAFTPNAGASCSTGDLCTVGGTCVASPTNPVPTCQGTPKCEDADPCTADYCDPATGACSNPPIVCDDGNPCTTDSCQGGTCVSVAAGGSCDDGNRCTVGDTCVAGTSGAPTCQGQAVNCDDGDACTADACDPVTGGCLHSAIAIADVTGLVFSSATTMTWPAVPGATLYDTYRGTIPAGGFGNRPPAGPIYDQTCFEHGDALGDGSLITTDAEIPPAGTAFYYLVSEETACGMGPIGEDSNGTPIPNSSPCPSP